MRRINKKGQVMQVVFIMIILLTFCVSVLVLTKVLNTFWAAIDTGGLATNETLQVEAQFSTVPQVFDYSLIFVIAGLTIGLIITSFLIPSHPIFMVFNIFGMFFLVFLAMTFSNLYGNLVANPSSPFLTEADQTPVMVFVMQYLPYICIGLVFASTVIMFAKGRADSQGGGY